MTVKKITEIACAFEGMDLALRTFALQEGYKIEGDINIETHIDGLDKVDKVFMRDTKLKGIGVSDRSLPALKKQLLLVLKLHPEKRTDLNPNPDNAKYLIWGDINL